jgi:hypothetical protein
MTTLYSVCKADHGWSVSVWEATESLSTAFDGSSCSRAISKGMRRVSLAVQRAVAFAPAVRSIQSLALHARCSEPAVAGAGASAEQRGLVVEQRDSNRSLDRRCSLTAGGLDGGRRMHGRRPASCCALAADAGPNCSVRSLPPAARCTVKISLSSLSWSRPAGSPSASQAPRPELHFGRRPIPPSGRPHSRRMQ